MGVGRAETAIVLFTDLVGSTAQRESLGDDRADEVRRQHDRLLRDAIVAHRGTEVKGTGDGLMVVFESAAEAVSAAVVMQQSIRRAARGFAAPVAIRIGISAGDVMWEGEDCFGRPVVEARRLCDATEGDRILVADVVRILAGSRGGHVFTSIGAIELKGLGEPVMAAEVDWATAAGGAPPLPEVLARRGAPFVGRAAEREQLVTAWKEARAGGRRVLLVSGEPGIGKTTLSAELARTAHDEGAVVLFGRCDEDAAVPYQPFAEALRGYAAAVGTQAVADQVGASLGAMARLAPGLFDLDGPAETADADTERLWLFDAVATWLTEVGPDTVLVLDDLHWAGKPTLLLLRHLLRAEGLEGLLVVGTYRDTDLGRGHPLAEMLADLRREPEVERISLSGLGASEVADFVAATAGHDLDDEGAELARAVHAETEGNPFFVDQVLRHLAESGAIVRHDGRWGRASGRPGDPMGIPEGVREVIGRRLGRLPEATNRVLDAAAVVGREFDLDLVAATADADLDTVLDAFEAAESSRLVLGVGRIGRQFTFAHALVRSTILDEIPTTRRLRLHRRAAVALEPRAAVDPGLLADVAHHYREAAALGESEKAVHFAVLASDHALEGLAYEEAVDVLDRALDVLDPSSPEHRRMRIDLLLPLGRALLAAGDRERSDACYWEVVDWARANRDAELLGKAGVALVGLRGWREAGASDAAVVAVLEEAAAGLPEEDSPLRALVLARLASELYFIRQSAERRARLRAEAVALADRLGDVRTRLAVYDAGFGDMIGDDGVHVSRQRCDAVLELAREVGDLEHEVNGLGWSVYHRLEAGDLDGAQELCDQETAIAERLGQADYLWSARVHAAAVAMSRAQIEEAHRLASEGLAFGQSAGRETALQMFGVFEIARRRLVGGLEDMDPLVRAMVEEYPLAPAWRTGLAYIAVELGDHDTAAEQLDILAPDDFGVLPVDGNWPVGISLCAFAAARLNDRERSDVIARRMQSLAGFAVVVGMPAECLGVSEAFAGLATYTAGRRDEGEALLAGAIERNRALGMPAWAATAVWEWARLLLRDGDTERARPLLVDAQAVFEGIGATRLLGLVEAELAGLG